MEKIKVKELVRYGGHNIRANGTIDLTLKCNYSELPNSMLLLQMLNNDVELGCKIVEVKPFKLGTFRIKEIKFDHDGESVLKFTSLTDYVEIDKLNWLIQKEEFTIQFKAEVEIETDETDENDEIVVK
ncbi:hypothetical protein [Clostridium sp.]|uniref:hypothetical protein n=1 Tax=Clostridium sp. TaxID=1506 RepID=UPI001A561AE0|nr:hypothetical protein [Clostridium sp.]MBK5234089.1 hypothetical protein [Clostridium sp.]